jgi:glycosyltransferase involved in cell wall biosynthesis
MRVAYACQDLASGTATGPGARIFAAATAMASLGHEVYLVTDKLADPWRDRLAAGNPVRWQPVGPDRAGHVYFTAGQSYADRLYDALRALHARAPLDVVDVPDAGGEAVTLLRAKRLLRRFPHTTVAVTLEPALTARYGTTAREPARPTTELTAYAERYVRSQASLVLSTGAADATADGVTTDRLRRYLPGLPDWPGLSAPEPITAGGTAGLDGAAPVVLWAGPIQPDAGLDVMLRAAGMVLERVPGLRLLLCGRDSLTSPVGQSYWQYVRHHLDEPLRSAVTRAEPAQAGEHARAHRAGTPCVLANGVAGAPLDALAAMAAGHLVFAPAGSIGADLIEDGRTGRLIPDASAATLAEVLVAGLTGREASQRFGAAAAVAARERYAPDPVGKRLSEIYASAPAPPPDRPVRRDDPVSVVIPLYNQGEYLRDAVTSVRRSRLEHLDIVVVDDGSTMPVPALAGDDIRYLRQPNRGLSAARNAGIRAARGSLILTLDADDMMRPPFLRAAVDAMRRHQELAYVGGYVRYFELLDLVYVPAGPLGDLNVVMHTQLKSAVLFRREVLEQVGGYDEELPAFEDWDLLIRLARAGYECDVLPLVGQLYRRHAASMSFQHSYGMRGDLLQYMVRKHAPAMTKAELTALLLTVVDMWKAGYEPSASALYLNESARPGAVTGEESPAATRSAPQHPSALVPAHPWPTRRAVSRPRPGDRSGPDASTRSASPETPPPPLPSR